MRNVLTFFLLAGLLISLGCTSRNDVSYSDRVKAALEQAELKDVTVSEDKDKNTITLGGTLHSEEAKAKAASVAQSAASVAQSAASNRIIANEISVQPVGAESEARDVASNLDDAIEKNYKAALISSRLEKQHIRFKAKNGALTLTGTVQNTSQSHEAEKLADGIPNVQQVVNQIEVRR